MNMDDLKKLKVVDLKNIIRNYKNTSCPAFSRLKKLDLINLIIKLNISQSRSQSKSPSRSQSQSRAPSRAPSQSRSRSRSRSQSEIVDKELKEQGLKIVAKKIEKAKKKFEKLPPETAMERLNRTGKRVKINEKIEELLEVQKYLNRILRDDISEELDNRKIRILLKR